MILHELDKLCAKLNEEYYINAGGCCFVTFCIATQLYKYNIPYKVVVLYDSSVSSTELRYNFRNNTGFATNDDTANHYILQVKGRYINLGSFNIKYYYVSKASYIKPIEIYNVYLDGSWNSCYDNRNNLRIYREIVKFFKKHEKEAKNLASRQLQ